MISIYICSVDYMHLSVAVAACVCALLFTYMYHRARKDSQYDNGLFYPIQSPHSRPLGDCETFFHLQGEIHGAYVLSAMVFNSRIALDESIFEDAFLYLVRRHPVLHSDILTKLDINDDSVIKRYIFDFKARNANLHDIDLQFSSGKSCANLYHSFLNSKMPTGRLWRAIILPHNYGECSNCLFKDDTSKENQNYQYILILQWDHCIMDGLSRANLFGDFLRYLEGKITKQPIDMARLPVLKASAYFLRHHARSSLQRMLVWAKAYVSSPKKKQQPLNYLSKFCPIETSNPAIERKTLIRLLEFKADKMASFRNLCRKNNATVHGAITVAATKAVLDVLGVDTAHAFQSIPVTTSHAVDMRKYSKPNVSPHHLKCIVGILYLNLHFNPGMGFWKMAENFTKEIHYKLIHNKADLNDFFALPAPNNVGPSQNDDDEEELLLPLVLTNNGDCDPYFYELGNAVSVRNSIEAMALQGFENRALFFNSILTVCGKLQWSVFYQTNIVSEEQVDRYIDIISKTLNAAVDNNFS